MRATCPTCFIFLGVILFGEGEYLRGCRLEDETRMEGYNWDGLQGRAEGDRCVGVRRVAMFLPTVPHVSVVFAQR
jgi:hypothetical protein